MAIKIALANQKGGVGKTTTSLNLADQLIKNGYKVLLIDCDPQQNSTYVYNAKTKDVPTMYDIFFEGYTADACIQHTDFGDIIPNDVGLAHADAQIPPSPTMYKYLKKALKPVEDQYDFILFDTPPAMGILLGNCLMVADYVIIPIECEPFSIQGLTDINKTIAAYAEENTSLKIMGLVKIKYKARQNLTKDLEENLLPQFAETIGTKIFDTSIRSCVKVEEANTGHQRLSQYSGKCTAAVDYEHLCDEILKEVQ